MLRARSALPWALFGVAALSAALFAGLWLSARSSDSQRSEVERVARAAVAALTNFSSETIDQDVAELRALATGSFAGEVEDLFGEETIQAIRQVEASSRGEIRSMFVQDIGDDSASVFAVARESITNPLNPDPQTITLRLEISLARVSGEWKISEINLFQTPDLVPQPSPS